MSDDAVNEPTEAEDAEGEPVPKTPDERVRYIVAIMRRNEWPRFPNALAYRQRLADEWGCAESTVRGYAAEAHRTVALDPEERAQLQQELGKSLLDIAEEARASVNQQTQLPDFANAIRATEVAAKFLGIELAADKLKVSGAIALESIDDLRKAIHGE
jgi:hypothetical protein